MEKKNLFLAGPELHLKCSTSGNLKSSKLPYFSRCLSYQIELFVFTLQGGPVLFKVWFLHSSKGNPHQPQTGFRSTYTGFGLPEVQLSDSRP